MSEPQAMGEPLWPNKEEPLPGVAAPDGYTEDPDDSEVDF